MSWAAIRENLWPPIDPRSMPQIDADLDDEFAHHLELLEHELVEGGLALADAKVEAMRRFGNITAIRNQCRTIALKERVMLQRINLVLMVIVLISVVAVSVQVLMTQRHNTLALQDITTQIAQMRYAGSAAEKAQVAPAEARVLVEGDIDAPGWYPITLEPTTYLDDVLKRARVRPEQWISVWNPKQQEVRPSPTPAEATLAPGAPKIVLRPDVEIKVFNDVRDEDKRSYAAANLLHGEWREVDAAGQFKAGGWALRVVTRGSIPAFAEARAPGDDRDKWLFIFDSFELTIRFASEGSQTSRGRVGDVRGNWVLNEGILTLSPGGQEHGLPATLAFASESNRVKKNPQTGKG